jgi:hypothetical protein
LGGGRGGGEPSSSFFLLHAHVHQGKNDITATSSATMPIKPERGSALKAGARDLDEL